MIKLIRALKNGENVSRPYEEREEFRMKGWMFLQAAHAAMDSASAVPMRSLLHFDIIRLVGSEEAWGQVPIAVRESASTEASEAVSIEAREKVPIEAH